MKELHIGGLYVDRDPYSSILVYLGPTDDGDCIWLFRGRIHKSSYHASTPHITLLADRVRRIG